MDSQDILRKPHAITPPSRMRHCLRASMASLALLSVCAIPLRSAADAPDFRTRPLLAGKASLTEPGFTVRRDLGVLNVAPELRIPVELVYSSASASSGAFGFGWRSPQLESSVRWERGGLTWDAPWGERIRFRPKGERPPKGAVTLEPVEAARKGRGLFAPYTDWESDTVSSDYAKCRRFSIVGKGGMAGWRLSYEDGRIAAISTPSGETATFSRGPSGELLSVSSRGVSFIEMTHDGGLARSMLVNGVRIALSYSGMRFVALPETADGLASTLEVQALASVRVASLAPETFTYSGGYLASAVRGGRAERFAVQAETPEERRRNILSEDRKSGVAHTGKVAGRLMSDADYRYSYPTKTSIRLTDALGGTATHDFDERVGTLRVTDFAGRTTATYYFMRHDVAYLGKVRKVVDWRGRDAVSFRYDRATGKPVRVTDRLGNHRILEYDGAGNCVRLSRRAGWTLSTEPVRSFSYDRAGRLASVSELGADGAAVRTVSVSRDRAGRPVRVTDGCRTLSVEYAPGGFPSRVSDGFGSVSVAYDRYNRPVSHTDACGTVTRRTYADHGGVARVERLDGSAVLSSVEVGYGPTGLPVSATDRDGRTVAVSRDALGRVVGEEHADGSAVSYAHDALGRLTKVVDENGNEIAFGWDRFGLSSRLTAAGQLTSVKRGPDGLASEVSSSVTGRVDRTVRRESDALGRVTRIEYAKGEVETFSYDRWGRISERTRGDLSETYRYDHFGRLAERVENGTVSTYAYDAYGRRTSLRIRHPDGTETVERRAYDRFGRLSEISSFGSSVKYRYDAKGRVSRQTVDGTPIDFAYDRLGRLAGKWLGGRGSPDASVEYEYSPDGRIAARTANGVRQAFEYDARGQLVAVKEGGADVERYAYDRAGNMVRKTVRGRTTTYAFDGANQLVSSTSDGVTTKCAYDAAGRLVREGGRAYRYGYLDKVLSVTEGKRKLTYTYHADGQLARADYGDGRAEDFAWDGLALVRRGDEGFVNEPHVGGGNPVVSSKGTAYLNDMLGTTVCVREGRASSRPKPRGKCTAAALTAFGEPLPGAGGGAFFTGKPQVEGLGYAFLYRNYRASLAKWQTADPLGYPDGWNRLAYCNNWVTGCVDLMGADIAFVDTTWVCPYDPTGLGGYPLLDLYGFMKDKWDKGTLVLDVLKINNFADFCAKLNDVLDSKAKDELQRILGTGLWFDALLRADAEQGGFSAYECVPPTQDEIRNAIGPDSIFISMALISITPDISVFSGQKFIHGCRFKWMIAYEKNEQE